MILQNMVCSLNGAACNNIANFWVRYFWVRCCIVTKGFNCLFYTTTMLFLNNEALRDCVQSKHILTFSS